MSDQNNNKKSFNLPAYINIPLFLYQDNRLEKSATLIAAFFYSLFTAGKSIKASKEYLCELAGIGKSQYYCTLNQLESCGYISRLGHTNNRKIQWVYRPNYEIIVIESNISPVHRNDVKELNTSPVNRTKLVRDPGPNYSGQPDTDIKEDIKDYKTTTTVTPEPPPSSSSFFSEKQKTELLTYKLQTDKRSNDLFLDNCHHHMANQVNDNSKFQRFTGLKNILIKLYDLGEHFCAKGLKKPYENKALENKIPSHEDFQNYKKCVEGYQWVGSWMQMQKQA